MMPSSKSERICIHLVLAAAFVIAMPAAAKAEDAALRKELEDANRKLQIATIKRDTKAVMAMLTPDFRMKPYKSGWLNRAQTERKLRETWKVIASYRDWKFRLSSIGLKGSTATGTVEDSVKVEVKDKSGITRMVVLESISRNVWKKTAAGWKFSSIEEVASGMAASGIAYVPYKKVIRQSGGPGVLTEDQARKVLMDAYAKVRKAFKARDAAGVMALTLPGYSVEYETGTLQRSQVERELRKELKSTRSVESWTSVIDRISVRKDTIVALVSETKATTLVDARGKTHKSVVEDTFKDTWVKTPAGWRNQKSMVISARVKIDGKVQRK